MTTTTQLIWDLGWILVFTYVGLRMTPDLDPRVDRAITFVMGSLVGILMLATYIEVRLS